MAESKKATSKKPTTKGAAPKKAASKKVAAKTKSQDKKITKKVESKKPVAKKAAVKAKDTVAKSSTDKAKKTVEKKPASKKAKPTIPALPTGVFRCSVSGIPVKSEKPNITDKTLAKLKELLIEERERNVAQADELAQEAVDMITDREAGDTQFDEESGEGDSVAVERERTLFLAAEARNTVEQIDRALERIKNGTYGVCVPSSRRISVARLEALPWTEVCVDCKMRSERRR